VESKSGERGIFNRISAQYQAKKNGRRDPEHAFGTNPCSEIILRPYQFCNLTEVVVRKDDTRKSLQRKIAIATILGTMQSKLTNFPYLRKIWKNNTEEERLLGVSLTGIMDSPLTNGREMGLRERLEVFRKVAVDTNKKYADLLNIPPSTAITCVKPSGTVSQLCDSASGIHARHSQYYIRTVRGDNKDPLTKFMIDQGVPNEPEVNKPMDTTVFSFPIKSPEGSVTRNQMSAIEQLEMWRTYQEHWCEHKPSITVSVREDEWLEVGAFVFKYFTEMSGVSFLPHSDHVYQQAPYQECSEKEYNDMLSKMPTKIKWADLKEQTDTTAGSQSLACSGDSCELVDIGA
jgi:ribonucleoside-diphosphate reductase alpha chain